MSPSYEQLTSQLRSLAGLPAPSAAKIQALKRQFGEQPTSDLLTAARLQAKAQEKLGEGLWWVTEKALQQATPWQVARVKSEWFSDANVYDLCCGIGGDSLQLARRCTVVGIDLDQRLVQMAIANASDQPSATFQCTDVRSGSYAGSEIHIDPDRRRQTRRSTRPDFYSPNWAEVVGLLQNARGSLVKLAPLAEPDLGELPESHRTWISLAGSVREQSLLIGSVRDRFLSAYSIADQQPRSAVIIDRTGQAALCAPPCAHPESAPQAERPMEWMVEPDAAIRAAGLTDAFAIEHGLSTLGGPAGFLTGSIRHSIPAAVAVCQRIVWMGSSGDRKVRRELRCRNMFPNRIKTRGVDIDPAKLQKRLRDCGDQPVTLWIGRNGSRQYAVVTVEGDANA